MLTVLLDSGRHPDVINGSIAPVPATGSGGGSLGRVPRGRVSMGGNMFQNAAPGAINPNFLAVQQKGPNVQPRVQSAPADKVAAEKIPTTATATTIKKADVDSLPAKPTPGTATAAGDRSSSVPASKSVPNTRAGSPTHTPAVNARAGRTGRLSHPSANGANRAASIPASVAKEPKQKVPSAADFPTLAGTAATAGAASGWAGKMTLAQVLSAPAPAKPNAEAAPEEKSKEGKEGSKVEGGEKETGGESLGGETDASAPKLVSVTA